MKIKLVTLLLFLIIGLGFIIRFYRLNNISLFGDELDFGYQALSLVQTGKDYYGSTLPVYFKSLSEWKTGAFIYTLSPFVAVFGITELGIRLPSVIFGTLTILLLYLLAKELTRNDTLAILSAFFLAITPWHIHYSRIGFEPSLMLFFFVLGILLFLRGLIKPWLLIFSSVFLAFSFVMYRTQIVFICLSALVLVISFHRELFLISKKYLFASLVIFLLITTPFIYQSFLGSGSQRFSEVSIFDTEKMDYEVGLDRSVDGTNFQSKLFHNKYTYFLSKVSSNFIQSYSGDFLFLTGDKNLRHSVPGWGMFYKYQLILLLLGVIFIADEKIKKDTKVMVSSWLLLAPLSSSLTFDGGGHATRLFMMILPLTILISYGAYFVYIKLKTNLPRKIYIALLVAVSLGGLTIFLHDYFTHYPKESEKWWHSGFKEAIRTVVSERGNYDKIIISSADEPAGIFFLAWSQYSAESFQNNLFKNKSKLEGFGEVSEIENYLFPDVGVGKGLYDLPKDLPDNYLYLATAKEIQLDLIKEPERLPDDLNLVKTILYPSGKPAFYFFEKR